MKKQKQQNGHCVKISVEHRRSVSSQVWRNQSSKLRAVTLSETLLWTQLLCRLQQLPMQLKSFPRISWRCGESKPSSCKLIKSFKFDLTGCTQAQGLISIKGIRHHKGGDGVHASRGSQSFWRKLPWCFTALSECNQSPCSARASRPDLTCQWAAPHAHPALEWLAHREEVSPFKNDSLQCLCFLTKQVCFLLVCHH